MADFTRLPFSRPGIAGGARPFCLALVLLCGGCAVGPDFIRPAPPAVERYTAAQQLASTEKADGVSQSFESGAAVHGEWWKLFRSAELDAAMQQALDHNASLQSAQAALRQSQQNLKAGYGVFYPSVGV
ncbi:MAG: TolC family protein, partial [Rhodanobacter sp.]